ncbi:MAG: hypothetical protein FH753_17900 [Firmicutes bacterium]|nr:hypothetical protein [Bacillota bacterium]
MVIKDEFLSNEKISEYEVEKVFDSKKNTVELIKATKTNGNEVYYVHKILSNHKKMLKEIELLNYLFEKGLDVPKVYYEDEESFLIEYIEGETLLEHITRLEKEQKEKFNYRSNNRLIYKFLNWIEEFYELVKEKTGENIILEDMNLRNFIYTDKLYGFDFEDCHVGNKERDIGRFCAFLLTYSFAFTNWKVRFTRQMLKAVEDYGYDLDLIRKEIDKEFISITKRRGTKIPRSLRDLILGRVFSFYNG